VSPEPELETVDCKCSVVGKKSDQTKLCIANLSIAEADKMGENVL